MQICVLVVLVIACFMVWQHVRYLNARRNRLGDQQPLLYSASCFHVVTFLEAAEGADLYDSVRELRRAAEVSGHARMVYAGRAGFVVESSRLGRQSWDAVVLVQYASRESYQEAAQSSEYREALAQFDHTYSHGMKRNPILNLLIPQALLMLRFMDIIRGRFKVEELTPSPLPEGSELVELMEERIASLLELRSVSDDAILIFNLAKEGDREQREANRSYGQKMIRRMAALAHGPMHLGTAVTVEGDVDFEQVIIVYYPGPSYFAELVRSQFFQGIIGDKQLGDTAVVPTAPILSRL